VDAEGDEDEDAEVDIEGWTEGGEGDGAKVDTEGWTEEGEGAEVPVCGALTSSSLLSIVSRLLYTFLR
jgi:hypothetical protein